MFCKDVDVDATGLGALSRSTREALAVAAEGAEVLGWFRAHRVARSDGRVGIAMALVGFLTDTPGTSGTGFERLIVVTDEYLTVVYRRGTFRKSWAIEDRGTRSGSLAIIDDQSYEPTVDVLGVRYHVPVAEIAEIRMLASKP